MGAFRLSDGFVISDDGDLNDEDARGSIRLSPRGGYAAREQVMPRTHRVGSRLPHGGAAVATAQIQDLGYDSPRLRCRPHGASRHRSCDFAMQY